MFPILKISFSYTHDKLGHSRAAIIIADFTLEWQGGFLDFSLRSKYSLLVALGYRLKKIKITGFKTGFKAGLDLFLDDLAPGLFDY